MASAHPNAECRQIKLELDSFFRPLLGLLKTDSCIKISEVNHGKKLKSTDSMLLGSWNELIAVVTEYRSYFSDS